MLNKPHNSIVTLAAVLLALVGVSKPAKAFLLAQANTAPTTFTVPDTLPSKAKVDMSTSNSTSSINQSLKESFADKFPEAKVNIETQSSEDALQTLSEGKIDLAGIGRNLTAAEKQKGLVAVPISREKIAIVVSKDNPYDGNLTISQFAQIFRGEITDWSEIGGEPGAINLVDSPNTNDTRQAFPSYPVFQESEFVTGSNTLQLDQDSTDEMISQLGENGIGYAVANDVINRDDVKIVTMHQTQPDDERYPFSQPFYLVYQGTPSPATEAFIGFATAQGGEQVVANRVGSMSTAAAVAIASKLGNKASNAPTGTVDLPETTLDGEGDLIKPDADADVNAGIDGDNAPDVDADVNAGIDGDNSPDADADIDPTAGNNTSNGGVDAETDGDNIAQANPDLEGSGETNPDLEGSGETNPDLEGSGETNPDLEGSGEANPDLQGSGEPNAAIDTDGNVEAAPGTTVTGDAEGEGTVATAKKGKWWWWLPLIIGLPVLAAIAVSSFGGKKKSDQEPAIGTSNGNIPDGGGRVPNLPDGGDLSAVGANTATGIGNVASNGVSTTSKLGGAAVAGGAAAIGGTAAAANFVRGKRSTEDNFDDNIDITLDDTDINNSVIDEIPSNPVDEFTTGQETKLQLTDQPTKLQTDAVEDIDENASGLLDGISNKGNAAVAGGAAAIGGAAAAASGFFGDRTKSSDTEDTDIDSTTIGNEGQTSPQTDFVSEQTTKLQTNDVDSDFDTDTSQEFRGDFVLDEETTDEFSVNTDTDIEDTGISSNTSGLVDGISNKGGAAIAGGAAAIGGAAAAASGFFGDRTKSSDTEDTDIDGLDTNISGFTTDEVGSVQTPEVDTDIEEINLDTNVSGDLGNFDTNISGFTTDGVGNVQTPEIDTDIEDVEINSNASGLVDGISNKGGAAIAGGAAAIGGAAAAASGFFGDRTKSSDTEDTDIDGLDTNTSGFTTDGVGSVQTPEVDTDIEEINLDTNVSGDLGNFDTNISGFTTDGVGNVQTPEIDTDIEDVEISSNTSGLVDDISNKGGAAIAGGAAAIGGAAAAASGFFGDRTKSSDTEDTDLDTDISSDFSADSGFANNVIADAETKSENADISLDDITFDDVDTSIDASLEETSLEGTGNSADISLDDITFDDVDTSTDIDLDDITFNDTEDKSTDNTIDNVGFDSSKDDATSDLLSGNTAKITDLSDDSNDMNNISTWLDSLETPSQNSEDISGWLDNLSIQNNDSASKSTDDQKTDESGSETEDISFQFLEDLLERDSDKENS